MGRKIYLLTLIIICTSFWDDLHAQVMAPTENSVLVGSGQDHVSWATGNLCNNCKYVTLIEPGIWSVSVWFTSIRWSQSGLGFTYVINIPKVQNFHGKNLVGGEEAYRVQDFLRHKSKGQLKFRVDYSVTEPGTGRTFNKTAFFEVNEGDNIYKKEKNVTFGPGKILDEITSLDFDDASVREANEKFNIKAKVTLVSANYSYLEDLDRELGKVLAERSKKVKHDQLVREAKKAEQENDYQKALELYKEALSYRENSQTRGQYESLKKYIEKTQAYHASQKKRESGEETGIAKNRSGSRSSEQHEKNHKASSSVKNSKVVTNRRGGASTSEKSGLTFEERKRMADEQARQYMRYSEEQFDWFFNGSTSDMDSYMNSLSSEIGSTDRVINALKSQNTENLTPEERQELEKTVALYAGSSAAAKLAAGANAEDVMQDAGQVIGAAVGWLEAKRDEKARQRRRIYSNRMAQAREDKKLQEQIYQKDKVQRMKERKLENLRKEKERNSVSKLNTVIQDPFSNPEQSSKGSDVSISPPRLTELTELIQRVPPPSDTGVNELRLLLTVNPDGSVREVEVLSLNERLVSWGKKIGLQIKYEKVLEYTQRKDNSTSKSEVFKVSELIKF